MNPTRKILPVGIFTGFPLHGQVNHILRGQSEHKFAVSVNEIAE